MNIRLRDIFFQLLRMGLWGEGKLSIATPMSADDWIAIRQYAINHTVEGIIYDSFPLLEDHQLPPQSLRMKWVVRVDQIQRHNEKMNEVIAEQHITFKKQGIKPILQKGQGVASYYRIPSHRISGDIDWCFEADGYAKARNFLKDKKLDFEDTVGFSLHYYWKNIHIEHHKKTFDFRSPLKNNYLKKLLETYRERQEEVMINHAPVVLLAPELQVLQVNIHILKHLVTYGISLRQFCDSARLYYSVYSKVDNKALEKMYRTTGILKWTHLLHQLLVDYIGLPDSMLPFRYPKDTNCDWMLEEVWYSGNFGFSDERFENGKKSKLFYRPDSGKRLWSNFKRYIKYAPFEAISFPIVQAYSKFLGKDSD